MKGLVHLYKSFEETKQELDKSIKENGFEDEYTVLCANCHEEQLKTIALHTGYDFDKIIENMC